MHKVGVVDHWPVVEWRQVWINPNDVALSAHIEDPITPDSTYVPGTLTCTARGVSLTTLCTYDSAHRQVIWEGQIGPDAHATDETSATNEIVITFRVQIKNEAQNSVTNVTQGEWTTQGAEIVTGSAVAHRPQLPVTGFAPNRVSKVPKQRAEDRYNALGTLWLAIPRLGVREPIVGVPQKAGVWDTRWLNRQIGWLEGTAFPTWQGNTVLTGHVYLATGQPGPFAELWRLHWGDQIEIHAYGMVYKYEVRKVMTVEPNDMTPLGHKARDWVTLVTCRGYDPASDTYRWRLAVQAVLMNITPEPAFQLP